MSQYGKFGHVYAPYGTVREAVECATRALEISWAQGGLTMRLEASMFYRITR